VGLYGYKLGRTASCEVRIYESKSLLSGDGSQIINPEIERTIIEERKIVSRIKEAFLSD